MTSIRTNAPAMQALQALKSVSGDLSETQRRVSTGLRVASAKDNPAIFAIAQKQRADSAALGAVDQSLQRGRSAVDVAMAAGQQVADLLNQMKALALTATDPSSTSQDRSALVNGYEALRSEIIKTINDASFDGINLLKGAGPVNFLSNAAGLQNLTVNGQDWNYTPLTPGPVIMLRGYSLDTETYATYALDEVNQTIPLISQSLASLGSSAHEIDSAITFNSKLQDALDAGIGNLVDADMAKESAKLQADQVRQQLATQTLSIANGSPKWIMSLFK